MTTLRPQQAPTPPDQSRPLIQDPSSKSRASLLLKRLTPKRNSSNSLLTTATMPSSVSSFPSFRAPSTRSFRSSRRTMIVQPSSASNLVQWLQSDCPQDLLPRILAFAGPQMTATFSTTNRFWRDVVDKESTWRTICEELYKWKEGDEIPESWKDFYKFNPCVPVDYPTVNAALAVVRSPRAEQARSIRVLVRPGRYILREAITVQAPGTVRVEVATMEMPDSFHPIIETPMEVEPTKSRKSSNTIRNIWACRTVEVEDMEEEPPPEFLEPVSSAPSIKRATLVLRTRRHNEPMVRVRQGCCTLRNLELCHISHGIDIWNGNAAVQIQPPVGPDDQPMIVVPAPTAVLDHVEITSASGRGIVNIDGGQVTIKNCYVHDCAATGIYVGGPGSRAVIEHTDVVRNGNGNTQHRRGIARGHSGIYLEQGHALINDCNVSMNSLTGISAVSPENAILALEESDLVSNGTFQLEMPAVGTVAYRQSSTQNNHFSSTGLPRSRSGLVIED